MSSMSSNRVYNTTYINFNNRNYSSEIINFKYKNSANKSKHIINRSDRMQRKHNVIGLIYHSLNKFIYKFTHKRYYRTYIVRRAVLALILAISIPVLSMMVFPKQATALDASEEQIVYEYFMNVEIQPGDSLWDYAERYAKDKDYKAYIKEVKEINHIYGSKINAGDTIILPYYSCIYF